MRREFLKGLASGLVLASPFAAPLRALAAVESATLNITSTSLLTIPARFYGLNIHAGTAERQITPYLALLKQLKPDAVRIMTNQRVDYLTTRIATPLSPNKGKFDWDALDTLMEKIIELDAEPYLALGYGPPHWMNDLPPNSTAHRPPQFRYFSAYAEMMALIVERYTKKYPGFLKRVTVENEPENVGYSTRDYIDLFKRARKAILKRSKNIQVGGPVIGFAEWKQPDGTKTGFRASLQTIFNDLSMQMDFVDWHVYYHSTEKVMEAANSVKAVFGNSKKPRVLSELNRNWRYGVSETVTAADLAQSHLENTGWGSVPWLASLYEQLQREGLDQVFYFGWLETNLGLITRDATEVRPNFFLISALTNQLGRKRVETTSTNGNIGCIATNDQGKPVALIYNRSESPIEVTVQGMGTKITYRQYSETWHSATNSPASNLPTPQSSTGKITIEGQAFVVAVMS